MAKTFAQSIIRGWFITRSSLSVIFLFIFCSWLQQGQALAEDNYPSFAVVELFTSEACSSCPPADDLLIKLRRAAELNHVPLYLLDFHVDSLNHLGWRDPYSHKDFSQRQRWYKQVLNEDMDLPQAIINGVKVVRGSSADLIEKAINKALKEPAEADMQLSLAHADERLFWMRFNLKGRWQGMHLVVALVEEEVSTDVQGGQNVGRKLRHTQVVRQMQVLAPTEAEGSFRFVLPSLKHTPHFRVIAFLQDPEIGQILAASSKSLQASLLNP